MGCLPSRSTTVSPVESSGQNSYNNSRHATTKKPIGNGYTNSKKLANGHRVPLSSSNNNNQGNNHHRFDKYNDSNNGRIANNNLSFFDDNLINKEGGEDDIMSILMNEQDKSIDQGNKDPPNDLNNRHSRTMDRSKRDDSYDVGPDSPDDGNQRTNGIKRDESRTSPTERSIDGDQDDLRQDRTNLDNALVSDRRNSTDDNSFDEELNVDLLRQYIAVDYEITQLEDKDALRIYHEKIEQLEQLERELDMISSEAEEVAARSETNLQLDRYQSPNMMNDSKGGDGESTSMLSGVSGSMSPKSSFKRNQNQQQKNNLASSQVNKSNSNRQSSLMRKGNNPNGEDGSNRNLSYSTVEEVFNRKIILEKERDKLKKEVEMVIIECDKLQQRYKKRDEILDKLFDGRTGNGLENHLEQQLNWLMEQKHYVDQVFYAWKRAETLTSQTCEQFASALELLKRLPKVLDEIQRAELAKSIGQLLIKSRQDMEQAQRYNPNVDAPFFTDTETERFDKIIDTISSPQSISQSEYSQIATVIQFAYKRAVSIRLWLEQILQITIARDSFELAEEYKWIAIQLRKERITLIKSKLQESPYRAMAQSIQEQMAKHGQLQQQQQHHQQLMITNGSNMDNNSNNDRRGQTNEVNRDSGIESDDIDIEEEIYRLLEMNKSRLGASLGGNHTPGQQSSHMGDNNYQLKSNDNNQSNGNKSNDQQRDQMMRERIQRRVRGDQPLASSRSPLALVLPSDENETNKQAQREDLNGTMATLATSQQMLTPGTPAKLKVELDEAARRDLLSK